jgi:hypothetical protein
MLAEKLILIEFKLKQVQAGQAVVTSDSFLVSWYKDKIKGLSEKDANELLNLLIELIELLRKYFIQDGKFSKPSIIRYWALASDLVKWISKIVAYI